MPSEKMLPKASNICAKWFVIVVATILAIAGIAKIWASFGSVKSLSVTDPITGIQFRHLFLLVGVAELATASICLFRKTSEMSLVLIAWIATSFAMYRLGLWWIDWKKPCGCLGNLTDAIHISPQAADNAMKVILACMLIGSYGTLLWLWKEKRKSRSAAAEGIAAFRETEQQI